ncbi:MAG TPA: EamA family transporter, partial [Nocardioidaceae bacterium]|nr:EamA family transporter [Nocardioidaceae bacterium]
MNLLLSVVGVIGVSASGPLMAWIAAPALAIAFWRNALGTAVMLPPALTTGRAELRAIDRRALVGTVFAGLMLAGHFATWVSSLKLTSVASATALQALQVAFVVLIDRLRGHPVHKAVLVGLLVSSSGVLVVSGVDLTLSTRALAGDLLAVAGGVFAAAYVVTGGTMRQTLSTTAYTTLCYSTCALVLLACCLIGRQPITGFGATTWLGLIAVTVSSQLLGHSIFNHLLAVLSPTVVSLVLLLEVPGAA